MLGGNEDQAIDDSNDGSKTYQIHAGGAMAPALQINPFSVIIRNIFCVWFKLFGLLLQFPTFIYYVSYKNIHAYA